MTAPSIELNPNDFIAYGDLGSFNARLGNYDDAISCFKKVLELDKANPATKIGLIATAVIAKIYFHIKDYVHCVEYMDKFDKLLSKADTKVMSPKTKTEIEKIMDYFANYRTVIKNASNKPAIPKEKKNVRT